MLKLVDVKPPEISPISQQPQHGPEDDKIREDWLNILKSPGNFQSAIDGMVKELSISKLITHAQDAYNKSFPQSSRQP